MFQILKCFDRFQKNIFVSIKSVFVMPMIREITTRLNKMKNTNLEIKSPTVALVT